METLKQNGVNVLEVFYCSHVRNQNFVCIKQKPGLINQAITKYPDIDLSQSFYVGDYLCDMQLAKSFSLASYGMNILCKNEVHSLIDIAKFL